MNDEISLYDKLPLEMLSGFYYQIKVNIDNGILSSAMYHEIRLIERIALKRNISLKKLYKQGSSIVENERAGRKY